MKRFLSYLLALVFLLSMFSISYSADKIESELVVYSTTGGAASWCEALVPNFQKYIKDKYGINIKIAIIPAETNVSWTKMMAEWPNPSGDVYFVDIDQLLEGAKRGYYIKMADNFSPKELSVFNQTWLKATQGWGIAIDQNICGLVVRDDCPIKIQSWNDLLDPKIKDRFVFSSPLSVSLGMYPIRAASLCLGYDWDQWKNQDGTLNEEKFIPVLKLVKKWKDNALTLTAGSGTIRPLVERGEAYAAGWWWSHAITEKDKGYQVRFVVPKEGAFLTGGSSFAVVTKAKHPKAAVEWVKFMLTKEGLETAYTVKHYSIVPREDMVLPELLRINMPPKDAKLFSAVDFDLWNGKPEINKKISELFTRYVIEGR